MAILENRPKSNRSEFVALVNICEMTWPGPVGLLRILTNNLNSEVFSQVEDCQSKSVTATMRYAGASKEMFGTPGCTFR